LAETLRAVKVTPTKAEAVAIAKGCDEQGQMADLLLSPFAVSWGELFASRRAELNSRKALELEEKRAQLWDAVRFMRSSRLYEQEAKSLAKLRALFPDDPEFASQDQSLQERWAREIIAQGRGARLEFTRDDAMRAQPLSAEQDAARREIARQAIEWARVHPQLAVDFALLLHFMEFRDDAIDALDAGSPRAEHQPDFQAERSPSRDWLRLELLLTARQFVRALDAANRLEIVYAHDPEAAFAVAYARAHALWGLGEKGMAVDLMRAIVRVRPGYRSAQSLLLDWSGGADA
jgi:hypothetical protein